MNLPVARVRTRLLLDRKPWIDSYGNDGTSVDYYASGESAARQGRPVWANTGTGDVEDKRSTAYEWRRGYEAARQEISN